MAMDADDILVEGTFHNGNNNFVDSYISSLCADLSNLSDISLYFCKIRDQ